MRPRHITNRFTAFTEETDWIINYDHKSRLDRSAGKEK